MSETGPGPEFMEKYALHKTPEVEQSVSRLRSHGKNISETKDARIDAHFELIEKALHIDRSHFVDDVKADLSKEFTIDLQNEDGTENTERVDQLVQGLFESEKEILCQRGMGAELEEYGDEPKLEDHEKYRQQIYDKKLEQEKTLGNWIDYLGSEEANNYPIWFKYLALRSLQKMGKRDRNTEDYSKRSSNTLQPFPDLSREALALTLDALSRQDSAGTTLDLEKSGEYTDEQLRAQAEIDRLADRGNFAKLYAHFQGEIEKARRERGESTAGEWIHWPKGSEAEELCKTLEGRGTEWCTAGLDVAQGQLKNGEFYIYYTFDQDNKPVDPRVAIYLINGEISEVRGVYGRDQDLELDFVDIAREKYKEFPGSEKYEKKDHDMKALTMIERKVKAGEALAKNDLIFLYEIDSKIEGFGHGADPRVAELRSGRDPIADAPIVFECRPEEIASSQNEINDSTKAYIGPLFSGIFQQLSNIEHIYTTFPEHKIRKIDLEIGGKNKQELENELRAKNINIGKHVQHMLRSPDFITLPSKNKVILIKLRVADLGFPESATTQEIYTRAEELGLEVCPAEVGPHLRLEDFDQPINDNYTIAMKKIPSHDGIPSLFLISRFIEGLKFTSTSGNAWFGPGDRWGELNQFVFRLRQVSQEP